MADLNEDLIRVKALSVVESVTNTPRAELSFELATALKLYNEGRVTSSYLEELTRDTLKALDRDSVDHKSVKDKVFAFIRDLNEKKTHQQLAQDLLRQCQRLDMGLLDEYGLEQILERARLSYVRSLENAS